MVTIGLISDIHANLPALQAVLLDARQNGAQAFWNLGDFVGYGSFPEEVVSLVRSTPEILNIQGNYDHKVLKIFQKKTPETIQFPEKWLAFEWANVHLSEESRQFLRHLPEKRRLQVENWRVLLVHGSPESQREHVGPLTPDARLVELGSYQQAHLICCGHSHLQFSRLVNGTRFVNPGSVGRPDDGDPRAGYALLTFSRDDLDIQLKRIEYNISEAVDSIRAYGLPEAFAQMLLQGKALDQIENPEEME